MAKQNTLRTPINKPADQVPKKKSRKKGNFVLRLIKKIVYYFFVISIGSVVLFKFLPIPFTWTMLDQKMESISEGNDSEIHYDWESWNNTSKEMHLAAVAAEDQLFPDHYGFDFKSMTNAFKNNMKGKKVRGASTISQQVAKNVFLWQGRSYLRKILEVYFTALIELIWGKERILEVYVNVAEMGHNTFGAEAASQKYFSKPAIDLNRDEAAKLAAVLPSPRKWKVTNSGPYVSRRASFIKRQMRALGGVSYIKNLRKF